MNAGEAERGRKVRADMEQGSPRNRRNQHFAAAEIWQIRQIRKIDGLAEQKTKGSRDGSDSCMRY